MLSAHLAAEIKGGGAPAAETKHISDAGVETIKTDRIYHCACASYRYKSSCCQPHQQLVPLLAPMTLSGAVVFTWGQTLGEGAKPNRGGRG